MFVQNLRIVIRDEQPLHPYIFTATVTKLGKDEGRSFRNPIPRSWSRSYVNDT